jgi:gamma-glutamylcyclotransferase (GGCT)/AIG2-like uncharacterized protein YtfP
VLQKGRGFFFLFFMAVLFIYGTLKRSCCNHHHISSEKFLGAASVRGYTLFHLGSYPGMVESEPIGFSADSVVRGELWQVSEECLKHLDAFEDLDTGLYRRVTIKVQETELATQRGLVHTYLYNQSVAAARPLGDEWRE